MLMIRFQRIGRTNDPAFRISVLEKARAAKAGNIVEQLGTYNPKTKALTLNEEKVKYWMSKGAQLTDSLRNLLISKGIIGGKKVNVLPKKTPIKKDEPENEKEEVKKDEPKEEKVAEPEQKDEPKKEEVKAESTPDKVNSEETNSETSS